MSYYFVQAETFSNIANAIREKTGDTELIYPNDMPDKILNIQSGGGGGMYEHPIVETAVFIKRSNLEFSSEQLSSNKQLISLPLSSYRAYLEDVNGKNLVYSETGKIEFIGSLSHAFADNNIGFNSLPFFFDSNNIIYNNVYNISEFITNGYITYNERMYAISPPLARGMQKAYYNIANAYFYPSCGNNIIDMQNAYNNCRCLIGNPVCGSKVIDMSGAYYNCIQLTGNPVCGPNVTNMAYTYRFCDNLIGNPACGNNVIDMCYTYANCFNLTGEPVCGDNVVNMGHAYSYCTNLTGSPVCGPKVIDISATYAFCNKLTGNPVCGDNVIEMNYTYQCTNLTGSPVCGNNVVNMFYTYYNCQNLNGNPVCGDNVVYMYSTYEDCPNLTGSPMCGPNVTNMANAYANCYNLTGNPACGDNVADMSNAYRNCTNLTGIAICGLNVESMHSTYSDCENITNAYLNTNRQLSLPGAFWSCSNLKNATIISNAYVFSLAGTFYYCTNLKEITVLSNCKSKYQVLYTNQHSFYYTNNIENITFVNALTNNFFTNLNTAFLYWNNIKEVNLYNSLNLLNTNYYDAFRNKYYLKNINIEINTSVGAQNAFQNCMCLITMPTFKDSYGLCYNNCFYNCYNLLGQPFIIGTQQCYNMYRDCASISLPFNYPNNFINTLFYFADSQFRNCINFTNTLNFTSIPNYNNMQKISIMNNCFRGCSNINNIIINATKYNYTICDNAFADCNNAIISLISNNTTVLTMSGNNIFNNTKMVCIPDWLTNTDSFGTTNINIHNWQLFQEEIAPTCAKYGKKISYQCDNCKAIIGGENIDKLEHTLDLENMECSVCKAKVIDTEPIVTWTEKHGGSYYFAKKDNNTYASNNKAKKSTSANSTFTIVAKKAITFRCDWSVSSEANYDKLTIILDDTTQVSNVSGTKNGTINVDLSAGTHTLTASYTKDKSGDTGDDYGTITFLNDEVTYIYEELEE